MKRTEKGKIGEGLSFRSSSASPPVGGLPRSRNDKLRVGVLFGGRSAEHEVSLQSAKNVIDAIDEEKYDVVPIGIDKQGHWHLYDAAQFLLNADNPKLIKLNKARTDLAVTPGSGKQHLVDLSRHELAQPLDVVFPVLHGPFGEDGTIQGLLKLMDVPFVGAGVLGSALGMDKDAQKRLLRDAGIPTAKFLSVMKSAPVDFDTAAKNLGQPVFVKPANLGSSVGIHKVRTQEEFSVATEDAFSYDAKILIEEFIPGREIECAVLGNETPIASIPGEIIPQYEFYSYEAKYIDERGAILEAPARLPEAVIKKVQDMAVQTFTALCLAGMARVDFFLKKDGRLFVNEANTIPGFTKISMYPKLWELSGIPYPELIDRLIQLAIERHREEVKLKMSY